jgi:hypothetical protein
LRQPHRGLAWAICRSRTRKVVSTSLGGRRRWRCVERCWPTTAHARASPCSSKHPTPGQPQRSTTPPPATTGTISAHSSTPNTPFLPGSIQARVSGKLLNFQLPRSGQYWAAVDNASPLLVGVHHACSGRYARYAAGECVVRQLVAGMV